MKNILLVEDEQDVKSVIFEYLKEKNFQVSSASNVMDAFNLFNEHKFDVVISDVIMPVQNGKQLYKKVVEENPDVRFIFISGYPKEILENESDEYDFVTENNIPFLKKPVDLEKLAELIEE